MYCRSDVLSFARFIRGGRYNTATLFIVNMASNHFQDFKWITHIQDKVDFLIHAETIFNCANNLNSHLNKSFPKYKDLRSQLTLAKQTLMKEKQIQDEEINPLVTQWNIDSPPALALQRLKNRVAALTTIINDLEKISSEFTNSNLKTTSVIDLRKMHGYQKPVEQQPPPMIAQVSEDIKVTESSSEPVSSATHQPVEEQHQHLAAIKNVN